jgi:hypothetical protein
MNFSNAVETSAENLLICYTTCVSYLYPLPSFLIYSILSLFVRLIVSFRPLNFFLICIVGGGMKVHSTLRPLNGLLCQPRVIMIMEKSVE